MLRWRNPVSSGVSLGRLTRRLTFMMLEDRPFSVRWVLAARGNSGTDA